MRYRRHNSTGVRTNAGCNRRGRCVVGVRPVANEMQKTNLNKYITCPQPLSPFPRPPSLPLSLSHIPLERVDLHTKVSPVRLCPSLPLSLSPSLPLSLSPHFHPLPTPAVQLPRAGKYRRQIRALSAVGAHGPCPHVYVYSYVYLYVCSSIRTHTYTHTHTRALSAVGALELCSHVYACVYLYANRYLYAY